jgi:hypothetical protein
MPATPDRSKLMHLTLVAAGALWKVTGVASGAGNGEHA